MTVHVSEEQVRGWIDEDAVREVTRHDDEDAAFNFQLRLSRLPVHVIKEDTWGPIRLVGKNEFDTPRTRALLDDRADRRELLTRIGPMLAATPGFYTFLDDEGAACELRDAASIQTEYRIYPDGASQQSLMDGVMAIAAGMRFVQNTVATMLPEPEGETGDVDGRVGGDRVPDDQDRARPGAGSEERDADRENPDTGG